VPQTQVGRHLGKPIEPTGGETMIDPDVLAVDIAAFAKASMKRV
jgi:hypothetical protein